MILEASGAFDHDPKRRRKDLQSNHPIGNPPDWLSEGEADIWRDIVLKAPEGLFTEPDGFMLSLFCQLMNRAKEGTIAAIERGQLIRLMASMGLTPADRSRISALPDKEKENPFAEFAAKQK
jgi:phage terminase small subunit